MLENFNPLVLAGPPALFGLVGLGVFAYLFKRPYIAIAGGFFGALLGLGITTA